MPVCGWYGHCVPRPTRPGEDSRYLNMMLLSEQKKELLKMAA